MDFELKNDLKNISNGFSLMEMMISLAVFSLMIGMAVPLSKQVMTFREVTATREKMQSLEKGLTLYYTDMGVFPPSGQLNAVLEKPVGAAFARWNGPYLSGNPDSLLMDAWGTAFVYANVPIINGQASIGNNRCLLLSAGGNRTAEWLTAGIPPNYTLIGSGDDQFAIVSSVSVQNQQLQETRDRLNVVMKQLIANRATVTFTDLDTGAKNIANIPDLGTFFNHDQWGNNFVWHKQLNLFYSRGPNLLDESSGGNVLAGDDIGGL
ncbi:MAG: type II secretion system protein GspG [SAR324 cluster bacterium]|nr:type II secretion system protein GspG [SAR324 cluster bacterium]